MFLFSIQCVCVRARTASCLVLCLSSSVCVCIGLDITVHMCAFHTHTLARRYGIFQLTVPEGLELIQTCPRTGFHPNPDTRTGRPLYDDCPHVSMTSGTVAVVDLRARK